MRTVPPIASRVATGVSLAPQARMGVRATIDTILGAKRVALVGASRSPEDFSRVVMRRLIEAGIDVVPVHPEAHLIEGRATARAVIDIEPPVEAVIVMVGARHAEAVLEDCAAAGVRRVWLHKGAGPGAVSDAAIARGEALGLELVPGECPLMWFGHPEWPHRVHRLFRRAAGHLPTM